MNLFIDPNITYFLLMTGAVFAVLALLSPGTGFIEILALFALFLAGYGIFNLPVNLWALGLLIFGLVLMLVSIRTMHRNRAKTTVRWVFMTPTVVLLIAGSIFLFGNPLAPAIPTGTVVNPVLGAGMPLAVLALTTWIGTKTLEASDQPPAYRADQVIGATGEAKTKIFHEGTLYVNGELWTARSDREIPVGARARVVGREGLILVVEPDQNV